MSSRDTYAAIFEKVAMSPTVLKALKGLGLGAGLAGAGGIGYALGQRNPDEIEALEALGIVEPGEYSVGVDQSVFGDDEEEEKRAPAGFDPYGGMY